MNYEQLLAVSADLGYLLLQNGAEIYRVEETIDRILTAYGVSEKEIFAIPSFIVVTITTPEGHCITKTKRLRALHMDLVRVDELNRLSRNVCCECPDFNYIQAQLCQISGRPAFSLPVLLIAYALTSFFFTLFFGGSILDGLCSVFCGLIIKLTGVFLTKFNTNAFFVNVASSAFSAAAALFGVGIGLGTNVDKIIIGALMNLVPGVELTNFMRDIIGGDLIAGMIKLTEALLIGAAIALGSGITLWLSRFFMVGIV